jgi:hypothetical protein
LSIAFPYIAPALGIGSLGGTLIGAGVAIAAPLRLLRIEDMR